MILFSHIYRVYKKQKHNHEPLQRPTNEKERNVRPGIRTTTVSKRGSSKEKICNQAGKENDDAGSCNYSNRKK